MKTLFSSAAVLGIAVLVAGCSPARDSSSSTVTVFAAASLKPVFTELGTRFGEDNPGTRVVFNFAGSSDLLAQLQQGAPADVFASADTTTMTRAVDGGLIAGAPVDFATNTLTIITPPENPAAIASFADLAKPDVDVVVCAPQVPCGSATVTIEETTGVTLQPVSEESSVTDVLGKVMSGQADAGLVYVTDAANAGDAVATVAFPESAEAVNTYPIATLPGASAAAGRFVELVTGPQGRDVLAAAGFGEP